ncbi:MAG TPA: GNAT family N-acetyltransferase [Cellulomonas sp.]
MRIRPFAPSDLPGMYRVCLLTGDAGTDATALYRDPDLLGHVYCGPYPVADPTLSWVVTDDLGVAGYVVGTADTTAFAVWEERSWWPALRERYPLPGSGSGAAPDVGAEAGGAGAGTGAGPDRELVRILHEGQPSDPDVVARYPALLHIDLLPRAQGAGLGRALITTLLDALRDRDVVGLHLGVAEQNTGALAFYDRVGLRPVPNRDDALLLGIDLTR